MSIKSFACIQLFLIASLLPVQALTPTCPEPDSVYLFENNIVAVEAEDLLPASNWRLRSSRSGYSGSGYAEYVGPKRCSIVWITMNDGSKEPNGQDPEGTHIGTAAEWLKIPVKIEKKGLYSINIHTYHTHHPWEIPGQQGSLLCTDAGVYTHVAGMAPPIEMSHGENANNWDWLKWGPGFEEGGVSTPSIGFGLEPGIYTMIISGRHPGYCADRIHIYPKIGPNNYPEGYLDSNYPLSRKVAVNEPATGLRARTAGAALPARQGTALHVETATHIPQRHMHGFDIRGRSYTGAATPGSAGIVVRVPSHHLR